MEDTLGVIVGRFQVPTLHQGHRALIEHVLKKNTKVLIVLGVPHSYATHRNPLSFEMRKEMIKKEYPAVLVLSLEDHPSDEVWSRNLDSLVLSVSLSSFYREDITLYGSRDSFIPFYSGVYKTEVTPPHPDNPSGESVRAEVGTNPACSSDFRKGIIYTHVTRQPIVYPVVDLAVLRDGEVLLGRKYSDPVGKARFIGGFVDKQDYTLESAVRREALEEAGIEITDPVYIGSRRVADWRYPGNTDSILTSFFKAECTSKPKAGDDLSELRWFPLRDMPSVIVKEHESLATMLLNRLRIWRVC